MRATLAAPLAAVFAVAGSAAVWNAIAAWLARRRLRRGANLVRIRDRRVHVDDSAAGYAGTAGDITVVLDAGLGMSSLSWGWIRDAVSRAGVRVVSFDRPGLGRSPPLRGAPWLRRVDALVDQMHEVLAEVGATRRLVLVGHSSSGMHVRLYAHRHPDEVPDPPALPAPPRPPPAAATAEARTARRGPLSCTASLCLLIGRVVLSLICTRLPRLARYRADAARPAPGTERTRRKVAGVVLVDAAHEQQLGQLEGRSVYNSYPPPEVTRRASPKQEIGEPPACAPVCSLLCSVAMKCALLPLSFAHKHLFSLPGHRREARAAAPPLALRLAPPHVPLLRPRVSGFTIPPHALTLRSVPPNVWDPRPGCAP